MITVTVDKLRFKKHLSEIEQITLKDFLYTWVVVVSKDLTIFFTLSTQKCICENGKNGE